MTSLSHLICIPCVVQWCLQSDDGRQDLSSFNRLSNRSGQDKGVDVDLMDDDRKSGMKSFLSNGPPGLDSSRGLSGVKKLYISAHFPLCV